METTTKTFWVANEDCDIENGTTIEANLEDIYSVSNGFDWKAIDKIVGYEVDKIWEVNDDSEFVGDLTFRY